MASAQVTTIIFTLIPAVLFKMSLISVKNMILTDTILAHKQYYNVTTHSEASK